MRCRTPQHRADAPRRRGPAQAASHRCRSLRRQANSSSPMAFACPPSVAILSPPALSVPFTPAPIAHAWPLAAGRPASPRVCSSLHAFSMPPAFTISTTLRPVYHACARALERNKEGGLFRMSICSSVLSIPSSACYVRASVSDL